MSFGHLRHTLISYKKQVKWPIIFSGKKILTTVLLLIVKLITFILAKIKNNQKQQQDLMLILMTLKSQDYSMYVFNT